MPELLFVDKDTRIPLFTVQAETPINLKDVAFQLSVDAVHRGRELDSYEMFAREAVQQEKINDIACEIRFNNFCKFKGTLKVQTKRKTEVARGLVAGKSNKEMASALGVTVSAIKFHMEQLRKKFGVKNRVHLAMLIQKEMEGNQCNEC